MLQAQFPDGQLFLQFRNDKSRSVLSVLDYQLRSFGLSSHLVPGNIEGLAGTYRSWLANRRILVVIDGAATPSQAMPLVPGYRGCAAIITSRRCFTSIEGAIHLGVGPLDGPSAYSLLVALLGEERVCGEEHSARELVRLCEGLPLALRIAAAKLTVTRNWQISTMVSRLQDEERRLDELEFDGAGVRTTLALTYKSLDAHARQLFRYLSLLGTGDFPCWAGVPLLDQSIDVAEDLLNALVRLHLIEISVAEDQTISFYLRDLVRIYATECLLREESGADRLAAKRRLSETLRNSPQAGRPARHRG